MVLRKHLREDGAQHDMKPSRKPFSKRLYEDNDSAKDFLVGWLKGKYFKAEVNPDKYGIDILSNWKGPRTGIEVEVKHNWKGPDFPYETVHFPSRKHKFLDSADTVLFAMFNHERTHMLVVSAEHFINLVMKNTKYTRSESFYEISIKDCEIISFLE